MAFNKNNSGNNRFKRSNSFGKKKPSQNSETDTFLAKPSRRKSFGSNSSNNSFGNRNSFEDRAFSDGNSFGNKKPFRNSGSFDNQNSFNKKRPFNRDDSFENRDSFGGNSFGNKKPFRNNGSFEEGNTFAPKKGFGNKRFSRNNEDSSNSFAPKVRSSSFRGNSSHSRGNFAKSNQQDFKKSNFPRKGNLNPIDLKPQKNTISLEHVLDYFEHNEIVNIQNLEADTAEMFLSKINLLLKRNVVESLNENTFKLNLEYADKDIHTYSYIKLKSSLIGNHYIVQMSPLNKNSQSEEEVIVENLKDNLKDRTILAKITVDAEKIIATPLFYLNDLTKSTQTVVDVNLFKGVYQIYDNTPVIIPLSFKSRQNVILLETPKNLTVGAIIEAQFVEESNNEEAIFTRIISQDNSATSASMLSVYQYNLRHEFSSEILELAKNFTAVSPEGRRDIRDIPLVTIDDETAKDFDDAIFAKKIEDREDTYKIYVAIADVAYYVKPNDALDMEAQLRGNSVYLPGFTIPMLPKELSNGWCSLNPNEDRGCLVMEGIVNRNGELESFEFYRGLMKSHARLTYNQVANAIDGNVSAEIEPLMDNVINPLKEAFLLLDKARRKRNAIELQSVESKFILDKNNNILDVKVRESLISHKIVEEFMIAANVATAKLISKAKLSLSGLAIYRVHAKPSAEKILNFANTLKSFGLNIQPPQNINGAFFNNLLNEFSNKDFANALNEAALRAQSQAEYSNENIGHFGLALKEYCHFTSPIRRYSDLMIHRLILSIINSEEFKYSAPMVANISKAISLTERLAFNAEKSADHRAFAKWLSSRIGESFMAEISTITNAGIFVNLIDNGASGLIPMRTVSRGFAIVDLKRNTVKDKQSGRVFTLGEKLPIIIKEADSLRGLLTFLIDEDSMPEKRKKRKSR
ncbi:MAG: VacB/RNase II family 3'-5' exoribonuclease [Alphaproteobacteria bacterium]|jgi:ribonuclease R|nr:VacB/RNase II family 3'-5' exoribonuclease [Alphaproteobacteria bacterium]